MPALGHFCAANSWQSVQLVRNVMASSSKKQEKHAFWHLAATLTVAIGSKQLAQDCCKHDQVCRMLPALWLADIVWEKKKFCPKLDSNPQL